MKALMNRGRFAWAAATTLMSLLGIGLLGMVILSPQRVLANLVGEQPVSIQSSLRADYSVDPRSFLIAPLEMRIVEEAIRDQVTPTPQTNLRVPTRQIQAATPTRLPGLGAATPTNKPATTGSVGTMAPTPTKGVTLTPTATRATLTPSLTLRWTLTVTTAPGITALPSATRTPLPPTNTLVPATVPPTRTPNPTRTPTTSGYPPPVPTKPYP